jgi:cytochrome c oxidase subunit 2
MNRGFSLYPEQASALAPQWDALYFYLWAVSGFFTVLIFLLIVYFAFRYRRRRDDDPTVPPQIIGSVRLEIVWSVIPFIFAMSFFFWGARLYFSQYAPPVDTLNIGVVGKQWMWKLQHPTGTREINTLHVPVNRPVKLTISSQDVIHSFFVPDFRIKMDAVPGRYTTTWFTATKIGEYHLFCTEYCGTLHSGMIGKVVVMSPEDYESWLAGRPPEESPVASGARLFAQYGCVTCHAAQAPSMAGLYMSRQPLADGSEVVADENYLRESIMNSTDKIVRGYQPIMPSFRGQMSEEQLSDIIAYIKSLADVSRGQEIGQGQGPGPANLDPASGGIGREPRPVAPEHQTPAAGPGAPPPQ